MPETPISPVAPILEECRSLLAELDRVEKSMSNLSGQMVGVSAGVVVDDISEIEGLIDAHSEAGEAFSALRRRIVALARSHALCPQGAPDEGYSAGGLRGLLHSIERTVQGFKQPAPEALDSPWEHIPSDVLASLEAPARQAADLMAASQSSSSENLPSDVELFLDRVIGEANHALLAQTKLPEGPAGSLPITAVSQQLRQITARKEQKLERTKKESADQRRISERPPATTETLAPAPQQAGPQSAAAPADAVARASTGPVFDTRPSVELGPATQRNAVPTAVAAVASAAEREAHNSADAWSSRNPERSTASERDYQELLNYGEGKLGLTRGEFADLLANLALLNHKQGRLEDSEDLHRKELMIRENELSPDHPKVATSLNNLALLCRDKGDHREARSLWERSLAIAESAYGSDHPKVALRLGNLADLLHSCGETEAAEQYYERLLALREGGSAGRRREVKSSLRRYADLLRTTRRKKEAGKVEAGIATPRPGWFRNWR